MSQWKRDHPPLRTGGAHENVYIFQATSFPDLRGFTDDPRGDMLPTEEGPWTFVRQVGPDEEWNLNVSRAVVAAGILENGFFLWGPTSRLASSHPIIESDRVEGTVVFDRENNPIGTIKRLLIEKASGRVVYVDVTFGGFLGIGVHHHTIPWEKLAYDKELEGYRTDITKGQVQGAPSFYGDDQAWPDPKREQETKDYWRDFPRGPI